uniref:Ring finger protein 14 n=1 Tax=Mus musculus TaxID=10090 RepID=A0A494BBM2_MOUSE
MSAEDLEAQEDELLALAIQMSLSRIVALNTPFAFCHHLC